MALNRNYLDKPSIGRGHAGVAIEGGDHLVPPRRHFLQAAPELLRSALLEVLEGNALLLDPGKVAEIEDALAFALVRLQHVLAAFSLQVAAGQLCGADLGQLAFAVVAPE